MEHPDGTIKRQWGFNYFLTKKGINRASADDGFIITAYNLRRIINIIGINELKEYMKTVFSFAFEKIMLLKLNLNNISSLVWQIKYKKLLLMISLKQLYLIQNLTV